MSIFLGDKSSRGSKIVISLPVQLLKGSIPSLSGSRVVFVPRDDIIAMFKRLHTTIPPGR